MKVQIKKMKLKDILKRLNTLLMFFAQHIFLTCLLILIVVCGIGAFLFYIYSYRVSVKEIKIMDFKSIKFEKSEYQSILKFLENEKKRFEEASEKTYFDPFYFYAPAVKFSPSPAPILTPTPIQKPTKSSRPSPSSIPQQSINTPEVSPTPEKED
jgi:hypothetical protein